MPPTPVSLSDLGPVAQLRAGRLTRRLVQLFVGLVAYGASLAFMVRGGAGLAPWDVLHSGIARLVPLSLGQVVVAMSFVVLLLWLPLRERPGLGTLANSLVVGFSADGTLALLHRPSALPLRLLLVASGVVLCAAATAMYIGSHFGRGPRDGLMTGLVRRTGWSVRVVRTGIELAVVLLGWLLGGAVGVGTLVFALAIGPLVQPMLPWFAVRLDGERDGERDGEVDGEDAELSAGSR